MHVFYLAQGLRVCRTLGPTACLKKLTENAGRKKIHDCTLTASNLQPSNLCSNAYRSLHVLEKNWNFQY